MATTTDDPELEQSLAQATADNRLRRLRNEASGFLKVVGVDPNDDRAVLRYLKRSEMFPSLREELESRAFKQWALRLG